MQGTKSSRIRHVMRVSRKALLVITVKLSISVLLVALILRRVDVAAVAGRLSAVRLVALSPFAPAMALLLLLTAWRWKLLAGNILPFRAALRYTWIGIFYGTLLPGAITGDLAKGALLAFKESKARVATLPASILMERIVGFSALLALFTVSAVVCLADPGASILLRRAALFGAIIGTACLIAAALVLTPAARRLSRKMVDRWPIAFGRGTVAGFGSALLTYAENRCLLAKTFLISVVIHAINLSIYLIYFNALNLRVGFVSAVIMYSALSVLVMIPISISAIGIRDWFALLYFQQLHLPPEAGVAFSWLNVSCGLVVALGGGLVQLFEIFRVHRAPVTIEQCSTRSSTSSTR